jgi:hypothetical protein
MTSQRASEIRFKIRRLLGHKQLNDKQVDSLLALYRELAEVEYGGVEEFVDSIFKEYRHAP